MHGADWTNLQPTTEAKLWRGKVQICDATPRSHHIKRALYKFKRDSRQNAT